MLKWKRHPLSGLTHEYSHSGVSPTPHPFVIPAKAGIHAAWLPEIGLPVNTLSMDSRLRGKDYNFALIWETDNDGFPPSRE